MVLPALSQSRPQVPTRAGIVEAMKRGFITQQLALSPEESQKFWPIYDYYSTEVRHAYGVYHAHRNEIELDEALLAIKKKYSIEFLKAISPGKINDFFLAEKDFNSYLRKEIQRRQMQGGHYPPPAGGY